MAEEPGSRIIKPDPDPTERTLENQARETAHLRELFDTKIRALEARLDAIDKATELFTENLVRVPTETDKQIAHLKELHEEKFVSVQIQFKERDTRAEQTSAARRAAVEAAIRTASDAVEKQNAANQLAISKSEAAFTKQIDQIGTQIETAKRAQDTQVGDIKDRLTMIEGRGSGFASSWMIGLGALGGIGTIAGLIALIVALTGNGGGGS